LSNDLDINLGSVVKLIEYAVVLLDIKQTVEFLIAESWDAEYKPDS
jgi:hypothetical protein